MTVDSNKQLLVQLSREYEAMRRANADIDYQSWVISRLREATKSLNSGVQLHRQQGPSGNQQLCSPPHTAAAAHQRLSPGHPVRDQAMSIPPAAAPSATIPHPPQLDFSRNMQPAGEPWHAPLTPAINGSSHYLALPGGGQAGFAVSRPAGLPSSKNPTYRVRPSRPGPKGCNGYSWRGDDLPQELLEQGVSAVQPGQGACFGGQDAAHPRNGHSAAPRQHSRRAGASHCLQDAAERERRLALSTALAKERVALGLHHERRHQQHQKQQGEVEGAGLRGDDRGPAERRWAQEAAQAEHGQVMHMAQQLLMKHDGLAAAMQATNEQVKQQQVLLQAALERLTAQPPKHAPDPRTASDAQGTPPFYRRSSSTRSEDSHGPTCQPLPEPVAGAWFVRAALPDVQQQPQLRQQPEGGTLLPVLRCPSTTHRHKHDRTRARAHSHSKRHACRGRRELKGVLRELLEGKVRGGGDNGREVEHGIPEDRDGRGQGALQRLIRVLRGKGLAGQDGVLHDMQQQQQQQQQHQGQQQQQQGQLRGLGQEAFSLQDRVQALKQQFMAARVWDREQQEQGMQGANQGGVRAGDLEDEAQQVLRKDAEAFQQQARLSNFDHLEDRLSALVQRLEQQVQQQQHLHIPAQLGGVGGLGSTAGATTAAAAAGGAAASSRLGFTGLPVRQQEQQQQQQQQPAAEQELGASEMHLIMGQLQRMEEQENALRQKWLQGSQPRQHPQVPLAVYDGQAHTLGLHEQGSSSNVGPHTVNHGASGSAPGSKPDTAAPAGASVLGAPGGGVLGGANAAHVGSPLQRSDRVTDAQGLQTVGHEGARPSDCGARPSDAQGLQTVGHEGAQGLQMVGHEEAKEGFQLVGHEEASAANVGFLLRLPDQEPSAKGLQAVGHGGATAANVGFPPTQLPDQGPERQIPALPSTQADAGLADKIDERTLESIVVGRRAFLQHQRFRDGDLVGTSDLNPVDVVEDVADMLLDELLGQQAQDLLGICDDLGEDMFEEEFST